MENTERLIYLDDLTGLYNRRYLYAQLPRELQAAQSQNYNLWLFMLDIDNFKMINDTYGHLYGDEVIKEIAGIIRESTKSGDKKIRYAGDEFTVILPNVEMKDVLKVAERLLAKIKTHTFKEKRTGKEINLTASLGIAGYPQDTSEPIQLVNLADKCLYISKQKGKNCISAATEITPDIFWKKDILDRFPCSAFIERDNQLLQLKGLLDKTVVSGSQLILISGELGIGKTRLLSEFENYVSSSGNALCLSARCEEKFMAQSYHIAGELLYKYLSGLDKMPEGILNGLSEAEVSALFRFMPILKTIPEAPDIKDAPSEEKDYIPGSLVKLLQNISEIKPLCLFVDDLHYIDQQSLEAILALTQGKNTSPILVIAAFSSRDISSPEMASSGLAAVINTEAFKKSTQILALGRLSDGAVKEMVANIYASIPLSPELTKLICKITKGNPLFVEELLKYLVEKEYVFYGKGKWIQKEVNENDLPLSIEDTIKKRIAGLSAETKEMIAKAAVIGDDFQVDLLQKIDSEDRGYVLDLIEAAKKIGLIYERGSAGRDEFSFVTGEIRKILFDSMGNNQMKQLHSRLGQIKEKLYPDKLANMAGELYYNFKKAEDWARAEQYANVIKEGKATFYDRTIKYAESLLEEAEEEKLAIPLSKKAAAIIPEIIRYTYIASVNYVLYPPQSKMRIQAIEEVHKGLAEIFSETEMLSIALVGEAVVVNNKKLGKEVKGFFLEGFISLLKNLNIESIAFEKGVGKEELSEFIDLINNPQGKDEGLSAALENSGIAHIKINELRYDTSSRRSKEKESLQEIMLMDYILGKLPVEGKEADLTQSFSTHAEEISAALEKLAVRESRESGKDKESVKAELMAKSIQKIGNQFIQKDTQDWSKYKAGLAKTVLSMEPHLRNDIFASSASSKEKNGMDIIKELTLEMPDEIIINIVAQQYLQEAGNLDKIRRLVRRFLSDPGKKEKLTPILKEKLNQLGAGKEECGWIFGEESWNKLSLEEKADKIITLPATHLFKLLPMMKAGSVVKELLSQGKDALVEAIMERLFSLLLETPCELESCAGYFNEVLEIFIQDSAQKLLLKFIQRLIKVCQEKEAVFLRLFFPVLNPHLYEILNLLIDNGHFNLIKELIGLYTKDKNILEKAAKTLEPIISRLLGELTRRIDANLGWMDLADILVLFKDRATQPLIEEALFEKGVPSGKYFEAYLRRFTIGKILNRLPKENLLRLLKERFSDKHIYVINNLVELIAVMEGEEITRILEIPLKHEDPVIRKKTIFVLGRIKGKVSVSLLAEALKDKDEPLRQFALKILKNRKDDFAVGILKEFSKNADLTEDIRKDTSKTEKG